MRVGDTHKGWRLRRKIKIKMREKKCLFQCLFSVYFQYLLSVSMYPHTHRPCLYCGLEVYCFISLMKAGSFIISCTSLAVSGSEWGKRKSKNKDKNNKRGRQWERKNPNPSPTLPPTFEHFHRISKHLRVLRRLHKLLHTWEKGREIGWDKIRKVKWKKFNKKPTYTFLPTEKHLPIHLPTCLSTYLTSQTSSLCAYLLFIDLIRSRRTYPSNYLPMYLPTYLPTNFSILFNTPTYIPYTTYLHTYIYPHTYPPTHPPSVASETSSLCASNELFVPPTRVCVFAAVS